MKTTTYLIFGLLLVSIVVAGCATGKAVGVTNPTPAYINANACTASSICPTNSLTSNGYIIMSNPSWYIVSEGWMQSKLFLLVGNVSYDNWQQGMIRAEGPISGSQLTAENGPIIMSNPSWYIASHGWMQSDRFLLVGNVSFENWSVGLIRTNGPIQMTSLAGNGTAYACIDANGYLYRSHTPCV